MKTKTGFFTLPAVLWIMTGAASADSTVIAGWHDFNPTGANGLYKTAAAQKTPDVALNGVGGGLYCAAGNRYNWGSTDGTFGTSAAIGNNSVNGVMAMRTNPGEESLYFTVVNHTGADLVLDRIAFDFDGISASAPANLSLRYFSGDLGASEVEINSSAGINALRNGTVSDYYDADWPLTALPDTTLAEGESATFRLFVSDAVNTLQAMAIDNIAVLGAGTAAPVTTLQQRESISVNFTNGDADKTIAGGEIAGFERSNVWNESASASGVQQTSNLVNQAGEQTTATMTTTFGHSNGGTGGTGSANDRLYRAYGLISGAEGVTVSNLPSSFTEGGYSVLVYFDIDVNVADRTHFFTIGDQTFQGVEESGFFGGTFLRAKGTTEATASATANYAVFTGLTDSGFTITGGTATGDRAALCGLQIVADADVDVYLLSGQSNMGGKGQVAAAAAGGHDLYFPEIFMYHSANSAGRTAADTLEPLGPTPSYANVFGPELGFADRLLELNPNGTQIAFIKHARDGRSLYADYAPGADRNDVANWGPQFTILVETVTNGIAELRAHGFEPSIRGMVWQQGEADAKEVGPATGYDANLRHFITRVREQFASDIGTGGMRFVLGQVLPYVPPDGAVEATFIFRDTVRAAQLGMDELQPGGFPNTATVLADNAAGAPAAQNMPTNEEIVDGYNDWDHVHLGWTGQLVLGRGMADLMTGLRVTDYAAWAATNNLSVNSELDDADGDHVPNLSEFSMGGDPHSPASPLPGTIVFEDSGTHAFPIFGIIVDLNASGVEQTVEFGTNLGSWASNAILVAEERIGTQVSKTYRAPVSTEGLSQGFFRVRSVRTD